MSNKPLTAIIVGAGHRSFEYGKYALKNPDKLRITGVADMNPGRREMAAKRFGFGEDRCFATAEELAKKPRLADAIINGTMDHQHVDTALPLLERGYGMLLEKPFATSEEEMWRLADAAKKSNVKVMICHVLRYAPFYAAIRQKIIDGVVGDIINIQLNENVTYHHVVVGYVRGKWNNTEKCHSTMLLAKSCHDMDIMMWMKSGVNPVSVASFGSNFQFTPAKRPAGAGTRCLADCPIEKDCLYSAKKHYIDHPDRWAFYVWDSLEHIEKPTIEQKIESLKKDNPYGRCVWNCDNNVVDHQSVIVDFADGSTGTLNMIGGASRGGRDIHIIGTIGEITGDMEEAKFTIRTIDPRPGHEYTEEVVDLNVKGDTVGAFSGHGGGDERLVEDFVCVMQGGKPSISCTVLEDSINGHLAVFRADAAREGHKTLSLNRED
jgi:predicted dehydrogenase